MPGFPTALEELIRLEHWTILLTNKKEDVSPSWSMTGTVDLASRSLASLIVGVFLFYPLAVTPHTFQIHTEIFAMFQQGNLFQLRTDTTMQKVMCRIVRCSFIKTIIGYRTVQSSSSSPSSHIHELSTQSECPYLRRVRALYEYASV